MEEELENPWIIGLGIATIALPALIVVTLPVIVARMWWRKQQLAKLGYREVPGYCQSTLVTINNQQS